MKISFCTTCMNRLEQLSQTLPKNLALMQKHDVEFVLVNYNSADELDQWIKTNFMNEIESGRLRYVHEKSAVHFHASKAKNIAHRLATGDLLFNLDADNFLEDDVEKILASFAKDSEIVVHNWSGTYFDGTYGRICITRDTFEKLGGYDESFLPVGFQDTDLLWRALKMGIKYGHLRSGTAIFNNKNDTLRYTGSTLYYDEMNQENMHRSEENILAGKLKANTSGHAQALISINFGADTVYV